MSLFRKLLFENNQIVHNRVVFGVRIGNIKPCETFDTKDGWVNLVGQNHENQKVDLMYTDGTMSRISYAHVSKDIYPGSRGMQSASQNPVEPTPYVGPYNFRAISALSFYSEYNQPAEIIPHRYIFFCPLNTTWNVRIFAGGPDKNVANYPQQWYSCSGNTVQPKESMKDNWTKWIELGPCKVDLEGRLIIKYWGDPTRGAMCIVNLIEITEI